VHTADCLPDSWFTNLSQTFWTTNWWVVSSPGYSASGPYNGGWISFQPTNCGSGTITFYGTFKDVAPCTTQPTYGGGTISISTNFYVGNVQILQPWKAVCTNGSTSFTLSNTCDTVTWEVSPIVLGGPYASGSTIFAGTNCGTYTVTARSTVNTNCTGSTTLYVVEFDSVSVDGATYVSSNNWAAVKTNSATDYVTLTANLCPFVTNAAVLLTWSGGGQAVPGNPLQWRVPKNASAKTTVTASCCGNSTNVNIWIIWANLTIKTGGALDPDDKALVLDNGNWPGIPHTTYQYGLGGGNSLGPINCLSNTNLDYGYAVGRMEAKAILTPTGIGQLLLGSWNMNRTADVSIWDNGQSDKQGLWDDTSPVVFRYLYSIADDIFDLDTPACSAFFGITDIPHTSEVYDNFYQYVTVNLGYGWQTCSDTNTWSYTARVDVDNPTNKVQLNSLSTSLIYLPSSPYYQER